MTGKKKTISIIALVLAFAISLGLSCVVGCKLIQTENTMNTTISQLQADLDALKTSMNELSIPKDQSGAIDDLQEGIDALQENIDGLTAELKDLQKKTTHLSDDDFNYLAIGNSITLHGLADYWWNEIGMAASSIDKDYVHLVEAALKEKHGSVHMDVYNFFTWETQAHDRSETLSLIDEYLDPRLDLVTIQLAENASDITTFERDFEELIRYIQEYAPDAQIIVVDDFWENGDRAIQKENAANATGVDFASLKEIVGDPEYQSAMGAIVYDAEGNEYEIDHEGVAAHPGDKGMEYIATAILDMVN